jgi:hypothetical protein
VSNIYLGAQSASIAIVTVAELPADAIAGCIWAASPEPEEGGGEVLKSTPWRRHRRAGLGILWRA